MLLKTPPKRRLTISLTPLIDVVFILLVFFMLASQFAEWRQHELPTISTSETSVSSDPEKTINAQILLKEDSLLLNQNTITETELLQQLEQLQQQAAQQSIKLNISVNSETTVTMQRNIDVLDTLQQAGYNQVNFSPEGK